MSVARFSLTPEQCARAAAWCEQQDAIVLERQRKERGRDTFKAALNDAGIPYYGACGGELTYEFTPTSIGTVERLVHGGTKAVLDLTDYDSW